MVSIKISRWRRIRWFPQLEGEEEAKEGKVLKFLPPNKLLTRLLILLNQIKAGNNSSKFKNENR